MTLTTTTITMLILSMLIFLLLQTISDCRSDRDELRWIEQLEALNGK